MSLGFIIGIRSVSISDILLLLLTPIIIIKLSNSCILIPYRNSYKLLTIIITIFILFCLIGYSYSGSFSTEWRPFIQAIRLLLYAFVGVHIPLMYVFYLNGKIDTVFKTTLLFLSFACIFNILIWISPGYTDFQLPGQNIIGQQISLFMPIIFYLLYEKKISNIVALLSISLWTLTIVASWSKGAWIILTLNLIFYISTMFLKRPFIFLTVSTCALLAYYAFSETLVWLLSVELSSSAAVGSNQQRLAALASGFSIALDYPFGVGSEYDRILRFYKDELGLLWLLPDPHNTLSHIAAVGGFGALSFYFVLLILVLRSILLMRVSSKALRSTCLLIFFNSLLLMQLSGEFYTQLFYWLWLCLFYWIGLYYRRPRHEPY